MINIILQQFVSITVNEDSYTANTTSDQISNLELNSISTTVENTEQTVKENLENRIHTIWQLILIILGVLVVIASTYLGNCAYQHWASRIRHISNANTAAPNIVHNESQQSDCFYEQIQHLEYEEPQRYCVAMCDENCGTGIITMNPVSLTSYRSSMELSTLNEEPVSENAIYQNQPDRGIRDTNDLYLTPTM